MHAYIRSSNMHVQSHGTRCHSRVLSAQGYGGGITPELVSSVKSSLRKTGIDLSPGASTETSLAAPAAAADDAAEESLDDSLDVEFL